MKKVRVVLLFVMCLVSGLAVRAQDEVNPWKIGFGVNAVDIRDASGVGALKDWAVPTDDNILPSISHLSVARYIGAGFSGELSGSMNSIEKGFCWNKTKVTQDKPFWDVNLQASFAPMRFTDKVQWLDPFIKLGGGWNRYGETDTFKLLGGVGVNFWITKNLGIVVETGYHHAFNKKKTDYFKHVAGIVIKFGGKDTDGDGIPDKKDECPDVAGLPQFGGCPDTDGDGIPDKDDECPEVAGLKEFNGCPDTDGDGIPDKDDECPEVAGLAEFNGCPDTDGDGIPDPQDECPEVAGPAENKGCPWPDTDGDGVTDNIDECPDVAGPASNKGCPEVTEEVQKQLNEYAKTILFDTGKATIKAESSQVLDQIVRVLNEYKNAKFTVEGHTDATGNAKRNLTLSQERADAVKLYIIEKGGVASDRLQSKGYGQEKPKASNKTKAGRALNRRVEINLVK